MTMNPPARSRGSPGPDLADLTVGEVLRRTAREHPDHDAVVFPRLGVRWSWSELDRRVDVAASGLIDLGVMPGEHVGIWSMNAPEWVVTQFAVARIGAVLVNINPAYRLHELEDALRMADVATLIVGEPFKGSDFVEMVEALCPEVTAATEQRWSAERLPKLRRLVAIGEGPPPAAVGSAGPTSNRARSMKPSFLTDGGPGRRARSTTSSSPRGRPGCPKGRCSRTETCC